MSRGVLPIRPRRAESSRSSLHSGPRPSASSGSDGSSRGTGRSQRRWAQVPPAKRFDAGPPLASEVASKVESRLVRPEPFRSRAYPASRAAAVPFEGRLRGHALHIAQLPSNPAGEAGTAFGAAAYRQHR